MQKGSAQLFWIVIALLLIAGGFFYLNSSKNSPAQIAPVNKPVSNIETYSNSQFNFEFKYAKDLKAKLDSEEEFNKRGGGDFRKNFKGYVGYEPGIFLGAVVVLGQNGSYDANPFSVWVFDNPDDLSINGWFDKYWYYPFLWGVFDYTSKGHVTLDKEATVSGLMAKYKIVSYQPGSPKYIYVSKEKKMYLFRIIGESGDKILQTFKFTD